MTDTNNAPERIHLDTGDLLYLTGAPVHEVMTSMSVDESPFRTEYIRADKLTEAERRIAELESVLRKVYEESPYSSEYNHYELSEQLLEVDVRAALANTDKGNE